MNTEDKPTAGAQAKALEASIKRLRQVATALTPAFVSVARGIPTSFIMPDRPGAKAVSRLVGQILLADAQFRLLKTILIDENVISAADFDGRLAGMLERDIGYYAEALNDGRLGVPGSFGFTPEEAVT